MQGCIFLRRKNVGTRGLGSLQLHENILVVEFPDAGIQLQEKRAVTEVAQEQRTVPVANEIPVVAETNINVFRYIEREVTTRIKIVIAVHLEILVKSLPR